LSFAKLWYCFVLVKSSKATKALVPLSSLSRILELQRRHRTKNQQYLWQDRSSIRLGLRSREPFLLIFF
jgi:hypothetical protein